jgi:hypothetical protein
MEMLLGDFNAEVSREDIFKPAIGSESLHEIINDNGVRVVHFAASKYLIIKSTMFPHRNIHKFTWTPPDGNTHIRNDPILIRDGIQLYLTSELSWERSVVLTPVWWWQTLGRDWQ